MMMKKKVLNVFLIGSIVIAGILTSCEDEDDNPPNLSPIAEFSVNLTDISEGESVSFSDESTNTPTNWLWIFGDGDSSIIQNPTHTYLMEGHYTVSLKVNNSNGSDTETKTNYITVISQFSNCGTVTDYDGNIYHTVTINNQCWLKENLEVTHYSDGTEIPLIEDATVWKNLENDNVDKAYCWYDNDINNKEIYGALYTYSAATNGDNSGVNVQGACPDGWHLPNENEWVELIDYLGGEDVAGGKMKEIGTVNWGSPNTDANNSSGFSARGGGYRDYYGDGHFDSEKFRGYWWTSTETVSSNARFRNIINSYSKVFSVATGKSTGFSVRCVKD